MKRIKVVQYGLGPIGQAACRLALEKRSLQVVGAVDIDPAKVGRDLGEVLGSGRLGVRVVSDARRALKVARGGCAILTTSSSLASVAPQIGCCAASGVNVVSSTEEMLLPDLRSPRLAARLDRLARRSDVTVLGTGVNPGFVMDSLPAFVSSVCADVRSVHVERFVDASTRREPLQRKVGAGISVREFNERKAAGRIGHVGLRESMAFLARALGWKMDSVREELSPVVARKRLRTKYFDIAPGRVCGIHNTGSVRSGGREVITLDLRMYVGCGNPHDEITLDSRPPMTVRIDGGTAGDVATAAMLVNAIPRVVEAEAGFITMMRLAIPRLVR